MSSVNGLRLLARRWYNQPGRGVPPLCHQVPFGYPADAVGGQGMGLVRRARRPRTGLVIYPMLLAVLPVLSLYAANRTEVPWRDLLRPAGIVLVLSAGMYAVLQRLLRNPHKAGLITAGFFLWWFGWGHLVRLLWPWPSLIMQYTASLATAWILCLAGGIWLVVRSRRPFAGLGRGLNCAALALVGWQVATIGLYAWQTRDLPGAPAPTLAAAPVRPAGSPPSIYHLILDGYARQDVLERVYHYDNRPFLDYLRSRGFFVAGRARANYCQTRLSITSMLACGYLQPAAQAPPLSDDQDDDRQSGPPRRLSFVERQLERQHYRLASLEWRRFPQGPRSSQRTMLPINALEDRLLAMMLLPRTYLPGVSLSRHARSTLQILERLPAEAEGSQPVFVRAHVLCPHPPFVLPPGWGPQALPYGIADASMAGYTTRQYIRLYTRQLTYLNERVQDCLDRLLARAGPNSIIILQADHGPGCHLDFEDPAKTLMKERFGILLAVRLPPGQRPPLGDEMTPVNLYRLLLGHYFGLHLPLLPDESYYSTWSRPLKLLRVTDEVRSERWPDF